MVETKQEVWYPGPTELDRSRILRFAREHDCDGVDALARRADSDPAWFWDALARHLDLEWQAEPTAVVERLESGPQARWFVDGALNIAENCVDRWVRRGRGAERALLWELEDGERGEWTFAELAAQVDRFAHALTALGVRPGDRVGIQLPMIAEASVALLGCAKAGAVAVPVFSGYGGGAVAERLQFAGAVVHVVAAGLTRRGRQVDVRGTTAHALRQVSTLRATVVVDSDRYPGEAYPHEVPWEAVMAQAPHEPFEAVRCPTDHPLLIAFTSGSTGAPKGIVLGHAGFAVKAGGDAALALDLRPGDTAAWITDPGWIMHPITLLGGLLAGSAVALLAGAPDYPQPRRVWDFAQATGVTMLGVSPTLIRLLKTSGNGRIADPGPLRVLASSGEPWTPDAYTWLFRDVFDGRLPIINYSGGTEVSGAILSNTTAQPIHPCGFAGPLPGMGADIVDVDGASVVSGLGELALRLPSPGMPLSFWGDPERYLATYWQRWPGIWHHGDWAERDLDGVWFIRGRSDDTLKIAGKRVGPSEIEAAVNAVPGIVESAAVGVDHAIKGESLVVFARVNGAVQDSAALEQAISDAVTSSLGKALRPHRVHVVPTLPKTTSGKILRRVIRAVYLGEHTGDLTSLDDPAAIDAIRAVG